MRRNKLKKRLAYTTLIVFSILFFSIGILNHYFFRTYTFDYGNYNFAFWDYSHFRISPMPTYPGNFLQDHFSFTLMYFIPVFWLINWITKTYTIIIIQYSFVTIAAWYSYKTIKLKTDNDWLGVGVVFYYFSLLGRYTSVSCDANIAVISACFIPIFIYYFEIRKYLIATIIFALSLFSRENIPLWFIFIFITLSIEHYKDKKIVLYCLIGVLTSVIFFILLFKVMIPETETIEKKFTLFNYSALGSNPGEALSYIIHHPIESCKMAFVNHLDDPAYNGIKAEFYLVYLISGGFALFYRPKYLVWFIPIIAQKVLNDSFVRWGISTYYSVEVITLLPVSVFLSLSSVKQKITQNIFTAIICIATIGTTFYKLNPENCKVSWLMNPAKERFYDKVFFTPPFDVGRVNQLLRQIPEDAKVSASDHLLPHLAQRKIIRLFPSIEDVDYIVFSVFDDYFMISHEENERNRNRYFSDSNWVLIDEEFPVFLFKAKKTNDIEGIKHFGNRLKTDSLVCDYEKIDSICKQVVFNNGYLADTISILSKEMFHSKDHSIKLTPENAFSRVIKIKDYERLIYIKIEAWCFCPGEKRANIIADFGNDISFYSNAHDSIDSSGWKRLTLSIWVPVQHELKHCHIGFWNSGPDSAYFDDLKITLKYRN